MSRSLKNLFLLFLSLLLPQATPEHLPPSTVESLPLTQAWLVTPAVGKKLIGEGATMIDARGPSWLMRPRLQGSIIVDWRQFSQPSRYQQGKLLADEQSLGEKLRRVGIFQEKAVVVFGDPQYGWGEEGRIVWMLRSLGHAKAVMVDGGYRALLQVGIPAGKAGVQAEEIGNFQIKRRFDWEISKEELERVLNQPKLLLIDVREKREFDGATPYGEVWGGPIPGAVHLYYHDLLDAQGYLLPRAAIRRKLEALGWSADREIVAYCTGGVRSAWFSSVLAHLGFNVKNYAGSMLEWTRENPPLNSLD